METTQILLITISVFISIAWFRYRKRCPHCRRWNGLKSISSEFANSKKINTTKTVKDIHTDKHGFTTGTTERQVDDSYKVNYYTVTYSCKSCPQQTKKTIRKGKYLKEAVIVFIISFIILFIAFNPEIYKIDPNIKNGIKSQNNIDDNLKKSSNSTDLNIKAIPSKPASPKKLQPQPLTNINEKTTNVEPSQMELENASINKKQNAEQAQNKQIIITEETPDYLKKELALKMLTRGKSINEISDSTFLAKKEIRKLKRSIDKK